ncbi:hypothetical protein RCG23_13955 [Neobacillus sp. PS3-34]|uniref:hypothetical protein n=1 Tax=Neobacillus sp. PS3-34 TaxID=3070678 RepID=UPI0027E113F9|nr:hypothetical protein [Neobacillus sp. PS3-34]WML46745.1 hypothetical protein RCG23_13955 [Neobacillus sp. PS3-34]
MKTVNEKFSAGGYPKEAGFKKKDMSLDDFILILQNTKKDISEKKQTEAMESIKNASDSWLSVEGVVVANRLPYIVTLKGTW